MIATTPSAGATGASPAIASFFAALVGLALAIDIFPAAVELGWNGSDIPLSADPAQHIIGQRYFIADAWRWPPLRTMLLGGDEGTNIALTDSIPIMALLAKSFRAFLPPGFHTIFLWLFLSYVLQPVGAVYALRGAGERRFLPCAAAAVVTGSMPALLSRYDHSALSGQFLILLALGLYFRICAAPRGGLWLVTTALLLISLLVQPYLLFMVAATLAAAPISLLARGDRLWRQALGGVGFGLFVTAATAMLLGYGAAQPPGGFGRFSMNLVSPVYPGRSTLLPSFGESPDATTGEYEGYNYLGFGVLLLIGASLASLGGCGRSFRWAIDHAGLILACLALSLLALSNRVYAGHWQIADLGPAPDWLQQFRSSGRFFWPVTYAIVIGSIVTVARIGRPALSGGLLLSAMVLQVEDTSLLRERLWAAMHDRRPWQIDVARLKPLLASHQSLTILPPYDCGGALDLTTFTQLLLLASEYAIPVNTMYVARRTSSSVCASARADTPLRDGELRVLHPAEASLIVPDTARFCRELGAFAICTRDEGRLAGLAEVGVPIIPVNAEVLTGVGNRQDFLVAGWATPGEGGIWTDGDSATIFGRLSGPLAGKAQLTFWGHAIAAKPAGNQMIFVAINEREIATWSIPDYKDVELRADIPPDLEMTGSVVIRLTIREPTRPIDRHINGDTRRLGFWLKALKIAGAS